MFEDYIKNTSKNGLKLCNIIMTVESKEDEDVKRYYIVNIPPEKIKPLISSIHTIIVYLYFY